MRRDDRPPVGRHRPAGGQADGRAPGLARPRRPAERRACSRAPARTSPSQGTQHLPSRRRPQHPVEQQPTAALRKDSTRVAQQGRTGGQPRREQPAHAAPHLLLPFGDERGLHPGDATTRRPQEHRDDTTLHAPRPFGGAQRDRNPPPPSDLGTYWRRRSTPNDCNSLASAPEKGGNSNRVDD